MSTDTADLLGVANGGKPIEVVLPTFTTKTIGQTTPVAAVANIIKVTIATNVNLQAASVVTLTGLATGSITTTTSKIKWPMTPL